LSANKLAYSKFCASLGCPLNNVAWSWSSISREHRRALFSVWADGLKGGKCVVWPKQHFDYKQRHGAREKQAIVQEAMADGYETYGILCHARDYEQEPRERKDYDDSALLVLELHDEKEGVVGYVKGEVAADDIRTGNGRTAVRPLRWAGDDLDSPPPGVEVPDRGKSIANDFRRDARVRDYVIRMAEGKCEYCRQEGFEMVSGRRYLEGHHIIGLAMSGPDTVDNVIALCATHHREAHYGVNAASLEAEFAERITQRTGYRKRLRLSDEGGEA
jgi:5-methylcytosine-specific restriction protein A